MNKYPYGVSFTIPAYNESKNIEKCIHAIQAEIKRYPDLKTEIIVINNASVDNTAKIANLAGAIVVLEKNKGVVYARNKGYKTAQYSIIAAIDADNRIPPGWLKTAITEINDPKVAAVTGSLVYTDVPKYVNVGASIFYHLARIFHYTLSESIQGGNYAIKKEVLDKMGGYDTNYSFYGEDTSTAQSASRFGKIRMASKMWVYSSPRRIKSEGLIKTVGTYTLNYFTVSVLGRAVTKKYLDHRD